MSRRQYHNKKQNVTQYDPHPNPKSTDRGRPAARVNPKDLRKKHRTPSPNTRIDAASLPRLKGPNIPIHNVREFKAGPHNNKIPPPCRANYRVDDEGSCGPRYIRSTFRFIPLTPKLANQTSVSTGFVIQPLANPGPAEDPVQLTEIPGMPRCEDCYAYMNPFNKFTSNGQSYTCSLCGAMNSVPREYFCGTDGQGYRLDRFDRPELSQGSYDIITNKQIEKTPNMLFVIDISKESHDTGFLECMLEGVKWAIDNAFVEGAEDPVKIGFMLYDNVVQCVTLDGLVVMSDINNPFLPVPPNEVLIPVNDRETLNTILSYLDVTYLQPTPAQNVQKGDPTSAGCCFGTAMEIAEQMLEATGGRVIANIMHIPNIGKGPLKMRDDRSLYGKKKEKLKLLKTQGGFYRNLSERCVEKSISFDLLFGASKYCDILTLSEMAHLSGGAVFHYPNFNNFKDSEALYGDLLKLCQRYYGLDCYCAIRYSPGVVLSTAYGGFSITEVEMNELRFAQINSDSTFTVQFEHESELHKDRHFILQVALLYTPRDGSAPLIRVHNLALKTSQDMGDIFRQVDIEAVMVISAKNCIQSMFNPHIDFNINRSLEQLVSGCTNVLHKYRKYCAAGSSRGQLILPDTLKLMPLYTLGYLKNPLLSKQLSIDERVSFLRQIVVSSMCHTLLCMYPNLYRLHTVDTDYMCFHDSDGYYQYPNWVPLTRSNLKADGVFLLNTGRNLFLCIGRNMEDGLFDELFEFPEGRAQGVPELREVEDEISVGGSIRSLVDELRYVSPYFLSLRILWIPDKDKISTIDEEQFLGHLIDDAPLSGTSASKQERKRNAFKMDYTDFLVYCHTQVRKLMNK